MFEQLVRESVAEAVKPIEKRRRIREPRPQVETSRGFPVIKNPWGLSPRQYACLDIMTDSDLSDKELAIQLGMHKNTFGSHILRAKKALGVGSARRALLVFDRWKQTQGKI